MNMHITSSEPLLFAVVDGEINPKAYERMLKLTASIAAKKDILKILIDASRVTGTVPAAERVEIGQRLADHVKRTGANPGVAFVGHPPTHHGLGAATARGQGVNVMLFGNIPDALKWLRRAHVSEKGLIRAASAHASVRAAPAH
jgi:hypothetical protein